MPVGSLLKLVLVVGLVVFVASIVLGVPGTAEVTTEVDAETLMSSCVAS